MHFFLSYSRQDNADAVRVERHLGGLNHKVWRDKEKLSGGHEWWPKICAEIRDCEIFVLLITPQSLESTICRKEYEYASRLRKRILPIICQTVKPALLWSELARLQCIDYWSSEDPVIDLVRAINDLPSAVPLPKPLPQPPETPNSDINELRERITGTPKLAEDEQRKLLLEIERQPNDTETETLELLILLRSRPDVLALVRDQIDQRLGETPDRVIKEKIVLVSWDKSSNEMEKLVNEVAAGAKTWEVQLHGESSGDIVRIHREGADLVLTATFSRWMGTERKSLEAMGWTALPRGLQTGAKALIGVGAAANLLVLLGLVHKRTRKYLSRHMIVRRFPRSRAAEAAIKLVECLKILSPHTASATARSIAQNLRDAASA